MKARFANAPTVMAMSTYAKNIRRTHGFTINPVSLRIEDDKTKTMATQAIKQWMKRGPKEKTELEIIFLYKGT
jgi:hypothetical protein